MKITEELDTEEEKEKVNPMAQKKPLIELIETLDKKVVIEEIDPKDHNVKVKHEVKRLEGITEEGNLIVDHDKKVAVEKSKMENINNSTASKIVDELVKVEKPMKKIAIKEIDSSQGDENKVQPIDGETKGESDKAKSENEKEDTEKVETKKDADEVSQPGSSGVSETTDKRPRNGKKIKSTLKIPETLGN